MAKRNQPPGHEDKVRFEDLSVGKKFVTLKHQKQGKKSSAGYPCIFEKHNSDQGKVYSTRVSEFSLNSISNFGPKKQVIFLKI